MSHVLLVEDNPWNQAVIEDNFRSEIDEAVTAGYNRYFIKPVIRNQLAEQLRRLSAHEASESLKLQPMRQINEHNLAC
jgi:response regulator of citrate/malate metabolism